MLSPLKDPAARMQSWCKPIHNLNRWLLTRFVLWNHSVKEEEVQVKMILQIKAGAASDSPIKLGIKGISASISLPQAFLTCLAFFQFLGRQLLFIVQIRRHSQSSINDTADTAWSDVEARNFTQVVTAMSSILAISKLNLDWSASWSPLYARSILYSVRRSSVTLME